jgi:hypothetical protein
LQNQPKTHRKETIAVFPSLTLAGKDFASRKVNISNPHLDQSAHSDGGEKQQLEPDVRTLFCIYLITRGLARQLDKI